MAENDHTAKNDHMAEKWTSEFWCKALLHSDMLLEAQLVPDLPLWILNYFIIWSNGEIQFLDLVVRFRSNGLISHFLATWKI